MNKLIHFYKNNKNKILLFFIFFLALAIRIYTFTGINTSDDFAYLNYSYKVSKGEFWVPTNILDSRILLNYPMGLMFYLFGYNNFAAGLWSLIISMCTLILVYHIGKKYISDKVGLLAAFFYSFYPLEVIYSTRSMPDVHMSFWMALSVLFFLKAIHSEQKKYRNIYFLISGFIMGISTLIKDFAYLLIFFYACHGVYTLVRHKKISWDYSLILIGFLFFIALQSTIYYFAYGDPLMRFKMPNDFYSQKPYGGKGSDVKSIFTLYPGVFFNFFGGIREKFIAGFFFYFIIPALAYLVFLKKEKSVFFIIWMLSLFLYLSAGTMSFKNYSIMGKEARYLSIITIPCLIVLSYALIDLWGRFKSRIVRMITILSVLFLLISSIAVSIRISDFMNYGYGECDCMRMHDVIEINNFMKTVPLKPIYTSHFMLSPLDFFLFKYNESLSQRYIKITNGMNNSQEISDAYVLIYTNQHETKQSRLIKNIPNFMYEPRSEWIKIKTIYGRNNETREYDPEIYYAPPAILLNKS